MSQSPIIRTIAMPKDTNPRGDIFGGWILSQMDLAGGELARKRAQGNVTTIAISEIQFLKPVYVGDVVSCFAKIEKVGTTSITIKIEVFSERYNIEMNKVTEGTFVFVAIDKNKKPRPVDQAIENVVSSRKNPIKWFKKLSRKHK